MIRALEQLGAWWYTSIKVRRTLQRVVARIRQSLLQQYFGAWWHTSIKVRRILRRLVARLQHRTLSTALAGWRDLVCHAKFEAKAESRVAEAYESAQVHVDQVQRVLQEQEKRVDDERRSMLKRQEEIVAAKQQVEAEHRTAFTETVRLQSALEATEAARDRTVEALRQTQEESSAHEGVQQERATRLEQEMIEKDGFITSLRHTTKEIVQKAKEQLQVEAERVESLTAKLKAAQTTNKSQLRNQELLSDQLERQVREMQSRLREQEARLIEKDEFIAKMQRSTAHLMEHMKRSGSDSNAHLLRQLADSQELLRQQEARSTRVDSIATSLAAANEKTEAENKRLRGELSSSIQAGHALDVETSSVQRTTVAGLHRRFDQLSQKWEEGNSQARDMLDAAVSEGDTPPSKEPKRITADCVRIKHKKGERESLNGGDTPPRPAGQKEGVAERPRGMAPPDIEFHVTSQPDPVRRTTSTGSSSSSSSDEDSATGPSEYAASSKIMIATSSVYL